MRSEKEMMDLVLSLAEQDERNGESVDSQYKPK